MVTAPAAFVGPSRLNSRSPATATNLTGAAEATMPVDVTVAAAEAMRAKDIYLTLGPGVTPRQVAASGATHPHAGDRPLARGDPPHQQRLTADGRGVRRRCR